MEAKHTTGPWSQKLDHKGEPEARVLGPDGSMIAELDGYCDDYRTEIANARLIAAAPELLDALQNAVEDEPNATFADHARAIIAKATGSAA